MTRPTATVDQVAKSHGWRPQSVRNAVARGSIEGFKDFRSHLWRIYTDVKITWTPAIRAHLGPVQTAARRRAQEASRRPQIFKAGDSVRTIDGFPFEGTIVETSLETTCVRVRMHRRDNGRLFDGWISEEKLMLQERAE